MKRSVLTLLIIFYYVCDVLAIPAKPTPFRVFQKDGTSLIVFLRGDEYFHYFASEDNVPILQGTDSSYYYATIKDSCLQRSEILAHNIKERCPKESRYIKQNAEKLQKKIREEWTNRRAKAIKPLKSRTRQNGEQQQQHLTGTKKGLVILVNFADLAMSGEDVQSDYDMQFNQVGYNQNNHIGSVHDYFYAQSYGAFDLTFDVVGPVTVNKGYSYYGRNHGGTEGNDAHPDEMIYEACLLADEYVDFKDYDWDNDGEVEQVFVIYAGYGESSGAPSNTIWPHQYYLRNNDLHLDDVKIYQYACTCELTGRSGKTRDGIGTTCHEFSHCLGLPDTYNIKYTGGYAMNSWDIMCNGGSNGPEKNGEVPCGYTAYERWCLGWLDFTVLDTSLRIKDLPPLDQEPIAYKIYNDGNPNEYLILENRQNIGWHSYVGTSDNAHGLLVYHLDYSEAVWDHNNVNIKKDHQRMSVIPADNSFMESDVTTDVFGEMSRVTEITNTSHQSVGGKWFNPNLNGDYYFNQPITNIKESDGMISFDFMGGIYVPVPQILAATEIHKDGFTLNWEGLDDVDSYSVEIKEMSTSTNPLEWVLIKENFGVFKTEEGSADGRMDLSIYLDSYTQTAGWTGKRIYTSAFGAKIGTDTEKGYLATPYFRIENNSVTIKCTLYSPVEQDVCISILNERGDTVSVKRLDVADTKEFVETFAEVGKDKFRIQILPDSPLYISSFAAYDGTYTAEKLSSSMLGSIIKPLQSITINNIMGNQYTISGLKGEKYKYRVKAEKEGAFSKWSDYQEVFLNSTNEISNIPNKGNVVSPKIYNMSGVQVNHPTERGFYIYDFGAYRKTIYYFDY